MTTPNEHAEHKHTPAIRADHLNFLYGERAVLHDLNFMIEEGDYVGILGPNGSGKTTLLKIILGLLRPSLGTIKIFGEDIRTFKDFSWIGYVPQRASSTTWEFPATVEEVVRTGRTAKRGMLRRFTAEDRDAITRAMNEADVARFASRRISALSGGELQRVFIARALAAEPKILILDEPTVGVDIHAQETFYAFIKKLHETQGITIIFVSHDIDVIVQEAKTILCLNRELICHVSSKHFINKDYLEQLYGAKGKYILHGH